ncbi:MAG: FixH family protein [Neisseria sp.]|nr:FixH family protein [Neisseria sp.]
MPEQEKSQQKSKVWYREPWPWLLMAGPAIVVVAAFYTFYLAQQNAVELVSDDYYKDGKHIDLDLKRDREAVKRNIHAQVLISPDNNAAKIFISGNFDSNTPMRLTFLHPAKKVNDQSVALKAADAPKSGDKTEFSAVFKPLADAKHWYVRLEDEANQWRVEDKWIVGQGNALNLQPLKRLQEEQKLNQQTQ